MPQELTRERIRGLIAEWVRQTLEEETREQNLSQGKETPAAATYRCQCYEWAQTEQRQALELNLHVKTMGYLVDTLVREKGFCLGNHSFVYHMLCRDLLKASIRVLDVFRQRAAGDYSDGTDDAVVRSILLSSGER